MTTPEQPVRAIARKPRNVDPDNVALGEPVRWMLRHPIRWYRRRLCLSCDRWSGRNLLCKQHQGEK